MKMVDIFNNFLYHIIEFQKCVNNRMEDPDYALNYLDDQEIEDKRNELSFCKRDKDYTDERCKRYCYVDFENFNIRMHYIRSYKQALKSSFMTYTWVPLPIYLSICI